MTFRIRGLSPEPFVHLYDLPDDELASRNICRVAVTEPNAFPDRVEMRDAAVGESVILLNHVSQPANTPYRATHAIFVREGAIERYDRVGEVPDMMRRRLLSLRGFDARGMMVDADIVEGREIESLIARLFENRAVEVVHAHFARRGCYAGTIERA